MDIRLKMDNWIVNDEYFITEGLHGYEVYSYDRTDENEAEEQFSSESFEECLTWIWNSL